MEKVIIQNPASADNDGIIRISRKSDFPLELQIANAKGEKEPFPEDCDFTATFSTGGFAKYEVSRKGETFNHCRITQDKTLLVFFDNHGLGCGRISVELTLLHPDPDYGTDGIRQETITSQTNIELSTQTAAEVSLELPKPIVEIKEVEKIVEKPVEKIVEKVVEKPVEVVKEVVKEVPKAMTQEEKDKMFIADKITEAFLENAWYNRARYEINDPTRVIKGLIGFNQFSLEKYMRMFSRIVPNHGESFEENEINLSQDTLFALQEISKGASKENHKACDNLFAYVQKIDGQLADLDVTLAAYADYREAFAYATFRNMCLRIGYNFFMIIWMAGTDDVTGLSSNGERVIKYAQSLNLFKGLTADEVYITNSPDIEYGEPTWVYSNLVIPCIGGSNVKTFKIDIDSKELDRSGFYTDEEVLGVFPDVSKDHNKPNLILVCDEYRKDFEQKAQALLKKGYKSVKVETFNP